MKASLRWIADLLGAPLEPAEARTRLTMLGALVEGVEPLLLQELDQVRAILARVVM